MSRTNTFDCACRFDCTGKCGLREVIDRAKSAVESKLPEDESDHTCAWVYRVAIETGAVEAVITNVVAALPAYADPRGVWCPTCRAGSGFACVSSRGRALFRGSEHKARGKAARSIARAAGSSGTEYPDGIE